MHLTYKTNVKYQILYIKCYIYNITFPNRSKYKSFINVETI